ncbi:type VII secretion protein EssC [Clostridium sp. Bc-iso-3]|nr:type VII secretion protein EssC [Clostridium sp. Bc-iso-3]
MGNKHVLHIYFDNFFRIVEIDSFNKNIISIGRSNSNDIVIDSSCIDENHCSLKKEDNQWYIYNHSKSGIFCNGSTISKKKLVPFDTYIIGNSPETMSRSAIMVKPEDPYDNVLENFEIRGVSEITIGKSESCNIVYSDKLISSEHAKIYKSIDGRYHIADLESLNGTFLNGKKVYDSTLSQGDIIHICGYKIVFEGPIISVYHIGDGVFVNGLKAALKSTKPPYPYIQRSPRLIPEMPGGEKAIPNPPAAANKPTMSLLPILLPPVMMSLITIITAIVGKSSYMLLSVSMTFVSVFVSISQYISQNKKFKTDTDLRNKKYGEILHSIRKELEIAREQQKKGMLIMNPDLNECIRRVESIDRKLWERTPQFNDFLSARIGIGTMPLAMKIQVQNQTLSIENDPLMSEPQKLHDEFSQVSDIPVCVPLFHLGTAGIIGSRSEVLKNVRALIMQLATFHSYEEVKIILVYPKEEADEWEWIRWLPHVWNENRQIRFLANDKETAHQLFGAFYDIIKEREQRTNKDKIDTPLTPVNLPHYVFILADIRLIENEAIMNYLAHNNQILGVSTIYLFDRIEYLPKDCQVIIELAPKSGHMVQRSQGSSPIPFLPDIASIKDAEHFSRSMAPIRIKELLTSTNLPSAITLLQLYSVRTVEELNILGRWKENKAFRSLAAPLGIHTGNEMISLDLHERGQGPHGLVAGTTGSGKSELLQSFIISVAINFHPHDVVFVLIDYKGGGMANAFLDMPHLVGTITNLGGNQTTRALVSIKSELKRRQTIFAEHGVNHIDSYQKLYHSQKAKEPLPHLVIIADEFAELKSEQPDFMRELVSTARVGRSLGVHLILATQKPAGVVDDQIWSNARFRICLKVQGPQDSQDVIKRPDAADIKLPGRAFIQVGNDEIFELFQSAWSGAGYTPDASEEINTQNDISEVAIDGKRHQLYTKSTSRISKAEFTQLEATVAHIASVAQHDNIVRLKGPWLPPLPEQIYLETLLTDVNGCWDGEKWTKADTWLNPVIGLLDDPEKQLQAPLTVDLGKEGHLIVYGSPGYGKTTLLQTLIMSLALNYSPSDVNMYILDFGVRTLGIFSGLPHVGGTVMVDEEEKLNKLFKYILKEMDTRKDLFSEKGVSSLTAYRDASEETLPAIVVIIDNFSAFSEMYPEYEDYLIQISREGGNLGIHIVVTCSSTSAIRYKLSSNFKLAIALQMSDKGDYSLIVGRTFGLEPSPVNGRGLVKGNPPLEFQTALPTEGESEIERTIKLKSTISEISKSWTGSKAKPIPVMPEIVYYKDLITRDEVKKTLARKPVCVPLGIEENEMELSFIDLLDTPHLLVSGDIQSGKTTFLQALTITLALKFSPEKLAIHIFDSSSLGLYALSQLPHTKTYTNDGENIADFAESLKKEIDDRKSDLNKERIRAGGLINDKDFILSRQLSLILIDDFNDFMQYADSTTKDLLEILVKKERNLGISTVMAGYTQDVGSSWDNLAKAFKDMQTGILLGSISDQQLFSIRLPYGTTEKAINPGDGYLVNRGRFCRVKTAMLENNILKAWITQIKKSYSNKDNRPVE